MTYSSASEISECDRCSSGCESGCGSSGYSNSTPIASYSSSSSSELESMINTYSSSTASAAVSYNVSDVSAQSYVINLDTAPQFIPAYANSGNPIQSSAYAGSDDSFSYANNDAAASYMLSPNYQAMITQSFLSPNRSTLPVIGNADEIMHYIIEAFEKTTGEEFPNNIVIRICSEKELMKQHTALGGSWNPGILGFAINNNPDTNLVFVKENNLDALMLTIGHEIGHVLTTRLNDPRDEEAKAFAFEIAWMKKLKEHNIANLANQFVSSIEPAKNGLHNVAFDFVVSLVKRGKTALQIFQELFAKELSVRNEILD